MLLIFSLTSGKGMKGKSTSSINGIHTFSNTHFKCRNVIKNALSYVLAPLMQQNKLKTHDMGFYEVVMEGIEQVNDQ